MLLRNRRPGNIYRDYLRRRREAEKPFRRDRQNGTFFLRWPSDLSVMTREQADYVGHLVNYGQTKADDDGWFLCTPGLNEAGLGLSKQDDRRILDELVARRFAECRWDSGSSGRRQRFVRVLVDNVERALVGKALPPLEPAKPDKKLKRPKGLYAGLRHLGLGFGLTR